jgi:hypothetical protein
MQTVGGMFSGQLWLTETAYGNTQTASQQWSQIQAILGYQAQMSAWERSYAYHWYADNPFIIRGKLAEDELMQLYGTPVWSHTETWHGPYFVSAEGREEACSSPSPYSFIKVYIGLSGTPYLTSDSLGQNYIANGYYGYPTTGGWKLVYNGELDDQGSCP